MSGSSTPRGSWMRRHGRALAIATALCAIAARAMAQPLDVDRDGRVDVYTDLVYIGRYLLGLSPVPPSFRTPGTTPIPSDEEIAQRIEALAGTPRPTDTPPPTSTHTRTLTATASATHTVPPTPQPSDTASANTATATRTRTPGTPSRTPTPSPTFSIAEGADVVRAAAELSVQNTESFAVIDIGCAMAGCGAPAASSRFRFAAAPRAAIAAGGPRGVAQPCSGGGTKQETCVTGVQSIAYDHCIEPGAAGTTVERDGSVVFTVAAANFCTTMTMDPLTTSALELQGLTVVERDSEGEELSRFEADWLDTLIPTKLGCVLEDLDQQIVDGLQEVRGTLHVECRAGSQLIPCRRGRTNLTLTTPGVEMVRDSGGFPCELGLRIDGQLTIDDRDQNASGQSCRTQFTQVFDDYLLAEAPDGMGSSLVRQDGRLAVDRFGPLDFSTQRQQIGTGTPAPAPNDNATVRFLDGMDCPVGGDGEVEVRRPPLVDVQATTASAGNPRGVPGGELRQRLYRATNGQVYQVLQNANALGPFGSDALQITTLAASEAGAVGQCAFTAGAEAQPQAVAAIERSKPFPLDRIFKSAIIPFDGEPVWNRNGGQSQGGEANQGAVCLGPDCQSNAVCPGGGQCVAFTIAGPGSTPLTQASSNAFGGIPAARLVDVPSVESAVGCRDLGDVVTIAFGADEPTIEIEQCARLSAPPQGDGFRLPNGHSIVLAYDASFSSLFNAAVAGFPVDTDGNNIVCPQGDPPQVLHIGASELGSVEAPTFRFQQSAGGQPQVVFDFLGGDPQGMQTVTGCIGISPLTICQ